jgi:hypothetical protein
VPERGGPKLHLEASLLYVAHARSKQGIPFVDRWRAVTGGGSVPQSVGRHRAGCRVGVSSGLETGELVLKPDVVEMSMPCLPAPSEPPLGGSGTLQYDPDIQMTHDAQCHHARGDATTVGETVLQAREPRRRGRDESWSQRCPARYQHWDRYQSAESSSRRWGSTGWRCSTKHGHEL